MRERARFNQIINSQDLWIGVEEEVRKLGRSVDNTTGDKKKDVEKEASNDKENEEGVGNDSVNEEVRIQQNEKNDVDGNNIQVSSEEDVLIGSIISLEMDYFSMADPAKISFLADPKQNETTNEPYPSSIPRPVVTSSFNDLIQALNSQSSRGKQLIFVNLDGDSSKTTSEKNGNSEDEGKKPVEKKIDEGEMKIL